MRRMVRPCASALLALAVSSSATASTVALSSSTLNLAIGTLPPISIPGIPTSIAVSSGVGTFTEPASIFGPTNAPLAASLFTGISLISGLTLAGVGNGTQFCTQTGPIGCSGGLQGAALVNVLQLFNLSIPLSVVGSPGASVRVDSGGIIIDVFGQGWTAGTASVTGVSNTVSASITAFATGTDQRTAAHAGNLVLVSGARVVTNVAGNLPAFATQMLQFGPGNQAPEADAGPDQTVECASPAGTQVTFDASGSTDDDSSSGTNDDIQSFGWFEGTSLLGVGESLTATLPLGVHTITLRVTDTQGATDEDQTTVTVEDTTEPEVTASLTPRAPGPGFTVGFSCSDACDASPTVDATVGGVPVSDGDVVSRRGGGRGPLLLVVSCTDASGNTASAEGRLGRGRGRPRCGLGFELALLLGPLVLLRRRGARWVR